MKEVVIVGPAYPYRGGIASFNKMLARTFSRRGDNVRVITFTVQYPKILFPGKTQYSESPPPSDIHITRELSSVNPFSWIGLGRKLGKQKPDLVILKYWTPFIGPSLGTLARIVRKNRHTKVIVQVDNITPHEHHFTDRMLNRYFINSVDGFVYMSSQVKADLDTFRADIPTAFSPHPIFEGFGEKVGREQACLHLELDPAFRYSLFFGIIRDYKGLDILLDAWKLLKEKGETGCRKLIVAGEFYYNREKYLEQISANGISGEVILHDHFIKDEEVKYYFSASDVLIQPYKTATQSGVTQIAYNFDLPMIVTDVGGLAEIVTDDRAGYVVEPDAGKIAEAFVRYYSDGNMDRLRANMSREKERFSWDAMADALDGVYEKIKKMPR